MYNFEKLSVYQESLKFVDLVYDATAKFPNRELFGISDQLRRASVSVVANIAEGSGRNTKKDFLHFLRISRSSLFECIALLQVSLRRKYLPEKQFNDLCKDASNISRMLSGLIRSLSHEKND